ncbi:3,5-bisphosphate nucleotidase [Gigaspora margarita]|uniref:3,5-bisphosphate nucleotidase n=1 Tax=Gigaspora margarita TaxID=4874 RepID=A0A8H4B5M2_GIGMA|nr:3,5-bisphosphate nucleotidase [Gigaspora margarita]
MSAFATERAVAIDAVLRASKICQKVFNNLITKDTIIKGDKTPVTIADFSAQAVINTILYKSFPNDPIVGEENSKKMQGDSEEKKEMRNKILSLANSVLDTHLNEKELLDSIDRGNCSGAHMKVRMWTVDPVDGTKGFIRGGNYAVGISLIIDGEVHLSVIGCPNFLVNFKEPESKKGCLFIAVKGQEALICESFVAKNPSLAKIASILGITKEPLHIDSNMCKYCAVARGGADIYLRLHPIAIDFEEKIWDHAPGYLLIKEAGGMVADMDNKPFRFYFRKQLKTNRGIVVASPKIYEQVVCAVQQTITKEI